MAAVQCNTLARIHTNIPMKHSHCHRRSDIQCNQMWNCTPTINKCCHRCQVTGNA